MKPEDFRASTQRPFTGEEYLKSLQDGREIYIYGERVKDVTTHPAFRNAAASVAQLYDALHKPEMQDSLCWNTDTGSGGYTHKFFRVAKSADDLRQQLTAGFDAISAATGSPCALLRPPYGLFDETCWSKAMDLVSAVVTWNLDSGDYLLPGADQVVETVVGSVSNGSIVLLTDNDACGAQTVEALPQIIDQLQEEGYRIVSLSELVKTDEELAEAVDLSRVAMPEDAVLPQLKAEDTEES